MCIIMLVESVDRCDDITQKLLFFKHVHFFQNRDNVFHTLFMTDHFVFSSISIIGQLISMQSNSHIMCNDQRFVLSNFIIFDSKSAWFIQRMIISINIVVFLVCCSSCRFIARREQGNSSPTQGWASLPG